METWVFSSDRVSITATRESMVYLAEGYGLFCANYPIDERTYGIQAVLWQ